MCDLESPLFSPLADFAGAPHPGDGFGTPCPDNSTMFDDPFFSEFVFPGANTVPQGALQPQLPAPAQQPFCDPHSLSYQQLPAPQAVVESYHHLPVPVRGSQHPPSADYSSDSSGDHSSPHSFPSPPSLGSESSYSDSRAGAGSHHGSHERDTAHSSGASSYGKMSNKPKNRVQPYPTPLSAVSSPSDDPEDTGDKRQVRLEKNRISASKSRERKRQYMQQMEQKVEALTTESNELRTTVKSLETENKMLRQQVEFLQNLLRNTTGSAPAMPAVGGANTGAHAHAHAHAHPQAHARPHAPPHSTGSNSHANAHPGPGGAARGAPTNGVNAKRATGLALFAVFSMLLLLSPTTLNNDGSSASLLFPSSNAPTIGDAPAERAVARQSRVLLCTPTSATPAPNTLLSSLLFFTPSTAFFLDDSSTADGPDPLALLQQAWWGVLALLSGKAAASAVLVALTGVTLIHAVHVTTRHRQYLPSSAHKPLTESR